MSSRYIASDKGNKQNNQQVNNDYIDLIEEDLKQNKSTKEQLVDIVADNLPFIGNTNKALPLVEKDVVRKKDNDSEIKSLIVKDTLLNKDFYINALGNVLNPFSSGLGKKTLKNTVDLFSNDDESKPQVIDEKRLRRQAIDIANEQEKSEKLALESFSPIFQDNYKLLNENSPLKKDETFNDAFERKKVANFVDLLIKNNIVPDDYIDIVRKARELDVPVSYLLYMSKENLRLFDTARESQSLKIGGIDTPITVEILKDADVAIRGRGNYEHIQHLERLANRANYITKRDEIYRGLISKHKLHSTGAIDNLFFGIGSTSVSAKFVRNYASDKIDDLTGFIYSRFASDENAENYNSVINRAKDKRTEDLVSYAQKTRNMPHDMRPEYLTEEYSKNGLSAAIYYAVKNHDLGLSLLYQEMPTFIVSGGVGKIINKPVEVGLTKTVLSKVAQQRVSNLSTAVITSGLQSAITTYPAALDEGFNKTGDYKKAKERADKQTIIEGAAGAISGLVPNIIKAETLPKKLLNDYLKNQAQSVIGVAGNATSSYILDGEVNTDALVSNFIVGQVSLPYQVARDHLGRNISRGVVHNWQLLKGSFETVGKMSLTEKDPQTAVTIVKKINDGVGNLPKKVFLPLDELIKFATDHNMKPIDLIEKVTGSRGLYDYARLREIDVPIPYSEYMVYIGSKQQADTGINAHIRVAPDAVTPYEFITTSKQINQTQKVMMIDTDFSVKEQAFFIRNDKVYTDSYKQGIAMGLSKQQATWQALTYHNFFYDLANTYNINSSDLFQNATSDVINIKQSRVVSPEAKNNFLTFKNGKFEIDLGVSLDSNNLVNSVGEFILNNLVNMSKLTKTDKALAKDINNIKKLLGVNNLNNINETNQKRFNSYLNSYLEESRLYSSDLAQTFKKFNRIFLNVYRLAKNLDLPIDDKLSQRFDHFLVAEEAVETVNASYKLVFDSAEEASMTEGQYRKYMADYKQYQQQVKYQIYDYYVNSKESKEWQKNRNMIYEEMRAEVNGEPVYQLIDYFTKGIMPDGSKAKLKKLDRTIIVDRYGEEVANKLAHLTTTEKGVDPNDIAKKWGYRSADEMIKLLYHSPDRDSLIDIRTEVQMNRIYGENPDYAAMNERALNASENEAKAKFLQKEAIQLNKRRILQKNKKSKKLSDQYFIEDTILSDITLEQIANQLVLVSVDFNLEPTLYLMAGREANKKAYIAAKKQDWETALYEKEKERLNHFLYLKAVDVINKKSSKLD